MQSKQKKIDYKNTNSKIKYIYEAARSLSGISANYNNNTIAAPTVTVIQMSALL